MYRDGAVTLGIRLLQPHLGLYRAYTVNRMHEWMESTSKSPVPIISSPVHGGTARLQRYRSNVPHFFISWLHHSNGCPRCEVLHELTVYSLGPSSNKRIFFWHNRTVQSTTGSELPMMLRLSFMKQCTYLVSPFSSEPMPCDYRK